MAKFVPGKNVKDSQEAEQIVAQHVEEKGKEKRFYGWPMPPNIDTTSIKDENDGKKGKLLNEAWVTGNSRPITVDKETEERIYISNQAEKVRLYHPSKVIHDEPPELGKAYDVKG